MYVFSSFVRIWRIARQKLGAGGFPVPILEQSSQRIPQPAVSVLRCYSSATKEMKKITVLRSTITNIQPKVGSILLTLLVLNFFCGV
ncbi:uncharacterized protein LOC114295064 isoform X2 [Camellia sinensis]|uniref:uncharacterized protein LOC114295064 isoform X2 n=1 Tax=Camellia sinensis TaxID=4442 RepID=UPI001035D4AA|nr:uncharacterized protein LOC114295064 isoform X2 [Camellia sinensis]